MLDYVWIDFNAEHSKICTVGVLESQYTILVMHQLGNMGGYSSNDTSREVVHVDNLFRLTSVVNI